MNRRTLCFVSAIVVSAILVLGVAAIQAQTPRQIPKFDPASGAGSCNASAGIDCVNSVITEDASNNIGIGTTSPSMSLDVMKASLYGVPAIGGKIPAVGMVDPPFDWAYLHVQTAPFGPALIWGHGDLPMRFGSENSIGSGFVELMRIDVGGNVGIGTAPAFRLDVAGAAHASSFPTSSDIRFKTNVTPLTGVLEKLEKVRGVSFEWNERYKALGRSTGHKEIGLVAQEVETVFPELVTTWGDEGYRAVDYGRLTAVLVEAVKELQRENEALRKKTLEIDGLRAQLGQVSELRAQVSKFQSLLQTVLAQRPEESGSVLASGR